MATYDSTLLLDDDDRDDVWWRISELEDALDVEGMPAADRAALASMHERAGRYVGIAPVRAPMSPEEEARERAFAEAFTPPPRREPSAWDAKYANAQGPNGICQLADTNGCDNEIYWVLWRAGVVLVRDVEKLNAEGRLCEIKGIGPKRAAKIREAIERYHAEQRTTAATTWPHQRKRES